MFSRIALVLCPHFNYCFELQFLFYICSLHSHWCPYWSSVVWDRSTLGCQNHGTQKPFQSAYVSWKQPNCTLMDFIVQGNIKSLLWISVTLNKQGMKWVSFFFLSLVSQNTPEVEDAVFCDSPANVPCFSLHCVIVGMVCQLVRWLRLLGEEVLQMFA